MSSPSTSVEPKPPQLKLLSSRCAGCRTIQPIALFLDTVDPACYRVRRQCRRCVNKSQKHWRERREHIKATRIARERECERLTCVCRIQLLLSTSLLSHLGQYTQVRKVRTGIVPLLKRPERFAVNASRPWSRCVVTCGGRHIWRLEEASREAIRRRLFQKSTET